MGKRGRGRMTEICSPRASRLEPEPTRPSWWWRWGESHPRLVSSFDFFFTDLVRSRFAPRAGKRTRSPMVASPPCHSAQMMSARNQAPIMTVDSARWGGMRATGWLRSLLGESHGRRRNAERRSDCALHLGEDVGICLRRARFTGVLKARSAEVERTSRQSSSSPWERTGRRDVGTSGVKPSA